MEEILELHLSLQCIWVNYINSTRVWQCSVPFLLEKQHQKKTTKKQTSNTSMYYGTVGTDCKKKDKIKGFD